MNTLFDSDGTSLRSLASEEPLSANRCNRERLDDLANQERMEGLNLREVEFDEIFLRTLSKRTNILGWLQIVAGVVLGLLTLISASLPLGLPIGAALALLSIFAGVMLLKRTALGWWASVVNQLLQVVAFEVSGNIWHFASHVESHLGFESIGSEIAFWFWLSQWVFW